MGYAPPAVRVKVVTVTDWFWAMLGLSERVNNFETVAFGL
jgi:hypothetical protein